MTAEPEKKADQLPEQILKTLAENFPLEGDSMKSNNKYLKATHEILAHIGLMLLKGTRI